MNIGILTLPLHTNYGGILQAYALQRILEQYGMECETFQYECSKESVRREIIHLSKQLIKKILLNRSISIKSTQMLKEESKIMQKYTSRFVNRYIKVRKIGRLNDIKSKDYDAIIVGSDQIWRKQYFTGGWYAPIYKAFLSFTKGWNIKRIAYATSFGQDNINDYSWGEIKKCADSLQMFDNVSVREKSGINICKEQLNCKAVQVVDPTMLLSADDYTRLITTSNQPSHKEEILCYLLDPNQKKSDIISFFERECDANSFTVGAFIYDSNLKAEEKIQPSVETWLKGFLDAKMVITDSYHACIFSILFRKPFVVIGNRARGMSRFISLLSQFGLDHHLISSVSEIKDLRTYEIPEHVYETLNVCRTESLNFIKKALYLQD